MLTIYQSALIFTGSESSPTKIVASIILSSDKVLPLISVILGTICMSFEKLIVTRPVSEIEDKVADGGVGG